MLYTSIATLVITLTVGFAWSPQDCKGDQSKNDRVTRIKCAFHNNTWVHPLSNIMNKDVILAAIGAGGGSIAWSVNAEIMPVNVDHTIFVLISGLGLKILESSLSDSSFIRSNLVGTVNSAFPSSLTGNLISLASGGYPSDHGVLGFVEIVDNKAIVPSLWMDAVTHDNLPLYRDLQEHAFPFSSIISKGKAQSKTVYAPPLKSPFRYAVFGDIDAVQTDSPGLQDVIQDIPARLAQFQARNLTSLSIAYTNIVADAVRNSGVGGSEVTRALYQLDHQLHTIWYNVSAALPSDATVRMVICSDHGAVDVNHINVYDKQNANGDYRNVLHLGSLLKYIPSVEGRSFALHLADGVTVDEARERIKNDAPDVYENFMLFTPDELIDLEVFGPKDTLSDFAKGQIEKGRTINELREGYDRVQSRSEDYFNTYKYKN
ncbi:hypothetical protein FOL47_000721 [Perkinsus chesapeaki]|uniref:Ectonucleotide pyrophosphatase phosphodiesterase n=1 Tax=Perkinsus chesapeaki TaxID=330153 RepID=A0A7J6MLQ6_PERCH|nr:hypothetical protein FOL47_000721 [Perkinsus chesapeaki]